MNRNLLNLLLGLALLSSCTIEDQGSERFINVVENTTNLDISISVYQRNQLQNIFSVNKLSSYTQDTISFDLGTNYGSWFFLSNEISFPPDSTVIEFRDGKKLHSICKIFKTPSGPCPYEELSLLNGGWDSEPVVTEGDLRILKTTFTVDSRHYDAAE